MKQFILSLLISAFALSSCNRTEQNAAAETETASEAQADVNASASGGATISFVKNSFDFGQVKAGTKVTHEFEFKNNGTSPLIISDAKASCGCTVPDYPKAPIAPGETGKIKVVFDSSGRTGTQHKVVTVTSNAIPPLTEVYLTGEVKN